MIVNFLVLTKLHVFKEWDDDMNDKMIALIKIKHRISIMPKLKEVKPITSKWAYKATVLIDTRLVESLREMLCIISRKSL
jgi:hypothetical protein